jgi:hypothetical protein
MMSATTDRKTRIRRRLATVVTTVIGACIVWTVGIALLSHDLVVPQTGGREPLTVTLPMVLFVSALAALLGWGTLAVLERAARRGTQIWVGLAAAVLLVSLVPLAAPDLTPGTRVVLGLLHLAVGVILIPGLQHTSAAVAARMQSADPGRPAQARAGRAG